MLNSGLDAFDNGFKVAPRKPHKAPKRRSFTKPNTLMPEFKRRLEQQKQVMLTEFASGQENSIKQYAATLRGEGWQIQSVKRDRALVGFELKSRVKIKREMKTATGQKLLDQLKKTGVYHVADFKLSRKYLGNIINDMRRLGYQVVGVKDGAYITKYTMDKQ